MTLLQKISISIGIVVALSGAVWSGVQWERDLAKKCDVELVANRLDQKIVADRIYNLQNRIWMLEDRYGGPMVPIAPQPIKNEYRQLQIELEQAKRQIKQMGG